MHKKFLVSITPIHEVGTEGNTIQVVRELTWPDSALSEALLIEITRRELARGLRKLICELENDDVIRKLLETKELVNHETITSEDSLRSECD